MSVAAEGVVRRAVMFAQSHPELLAAILATLIIVAGGAYVLRRFSQPPGVRFASMIAEHDRITVLTHPNPDPDAMAAAMGVVSLAEQVRTEATIRFPGKIRHQENRAFRNVLEVDLTCIERAADLPSESVILVDHNEPRGSPTPSKSARSPSSTTTWERDVAKRSPTFEPSAAPVRA